MILANGGRGGFSLIDALKGCSGCSLPEQTALACKCRSSYKIFFPKKHYPSGDRSTFSYAYVDLGLQQATLLLNLSREVLGRNPNLQYTSSGIDVYCDSVIEARQRGGLLTQVQSGLKPIPKSIKPAVVSERKFLFYFSSIF